MARAPIWSPRHIKWPTAAPVVAEPPAAAPVATEPPVPVLVLVLILGAPVRQFDAAMPPDNPQFARARELLGMGCAIPTIRLALSRLTVAELTWLAEHDAG